MNDSYFNDDFVKKYSKLVYTAVERRLRGCGFAPGHEEILDIQQEVFASIWEGKKLDKIRNPDSIPYWIAIVSGNAAMQYMRKRRRIEPEKPVLLSDELEETELAGLIPPAGLNPSEELDRDELSRRIDDAIESLPVKEKLIIKLHILHSKKHGEIADMLNLPEGTVSSYIKRAKEKLRVYLKEFK